MAQHKYHHNEEEDLGPSKSAMKRASKALQDLGAELAELGKERLAKVPIDEDLRDAVKDYQRFTAHEAKRRQLAGRKLDMDDLRLRSDQIDLARIGLGIAFIPDFCLSQTADSDSLFIVETKESLPERELVIAHNEKVPVSKAAQEFLSYF